MTNEELEALEKRAKVAALTYSSGFGTVEVDAEDLLSILAALRARRPMTGMTPGHKDDCWCFVCEAAWKRRAAKEGA